MRKKISPQIIKELIDTIQEFKDFSVFEVENGISTEVFRLTNHEKEYYLRVAPEGENISTEATIHRLAIQAGVLVPTCMYYEDFNTKLSRSFMVTSSIAGEPVTEYKKDNSNIIENAGRDLALLHTIKIEGFGWFDRKTANTNELVCSFGTYAEFIFEGLKILDRLALLKEKGIISASISDNVYSYILSNKNKLDSKQGVLSHSDLGNEHIFFNHDEYSGLIDFGDATAMSVYNDLAKYSLNEPNDYPTLLEGYLEINPLQDNYLEIIKVEAVIVIVKTLFWKATQAQHLLKSNLYYFDFLKENFSK